jgi:hypothetical protein
VAGSGQQRPGSRGTERWRRHTVRAVSDIIDDATSVDQAELAAEQAVVRTVEKVQLRQGDEARRDMRQLVR